jgi:transposase-like protein
MLDIAQKRHTPDQIIRRLREVEVALAQGQTVARVCRSVGVAEQTFHPWRNEYSGPKLDQLK